MKVGKIEMKRSEKPEVEKEKPPEEPPEYVKDFINYYGSNLEKDLETFKLEEEAKKATENLE